MKEQTKILAMMSIIDENLARIFLQKTPLNEAVAPSIDLNRISKRIEQFRTYTDQTINLFPLSNTVDADYLRDEVNWSLTHCNKYLKSLESEEDQIENRESVQTIINRYTQVLLSLRP